MSPFRSLIRSPVSYTLTNQSLTVPLLTTTVHSWNFVQVTSPSLCLVWGLQQICPKVLKVVHMQHFFIYVWKPSEQFGSGHLYPSIFPDLLAPNPVKFSAMLSVEYSQCTRAYTLSWTDTIDVSPVQMDFSMIAQRMAKDNCSPNLISTKRWWALFWLPWLTVHLYVGLLRSNGISRTLSTRTCVHIIFHFRPAWLPSVDFI